MMALKETFFSIMTPELINNLLIFLAVGLIGAVIAVTIGVIINHYITKKLINKWIKKEIPQMTSFYEKSIKLVIIAFQLIILLFFFSITADFLQLETLNSIISNLFSLVPIIAIAIIILIFGLTISKFISSKIISINSEYSSFIAIFIEFVIIYATVLTTLEFFNVKATPFLEIFKVILYTGAAIAAISIGIPIGISVKESIEKSQKNAKKKN
jgi:uncharacterized protein YneF (UPF0154 family)